MPAPGQTRRLFDRRTEREWRLHSSCAGLYCMPMPRSRKPHRRPTIPFPEVVACGRVNSPDPAHRTTAPHRSQPPCRDSTTVTQNRADQLRQSARAFRRASSGPQVSTTAGPVAVSRQYATAYESTSTATRRSSAVKARFPGDLVEQLKATRAVTDEPGVSQRTVERYVQDHAKHSHMDLAQRLKDAVRPRPNPLAGGQPPRSSTHSPGSASPPRPQQSHCGESARAGTPGPAQHHWCREPVTAPTMASVVSRTRCFTCREPVPPTADGTVKTIMAAAAARRLVPHGRVLVWPFEVSQAAPR